MQNKYVFLFLLPLMLGLAACQTNKMNEKEEMYKEVTRKINQIFDNGNVDELDSYITDNAVDHAMDTSMSKKQGLAGIKEMFSKFHKIIPDLKTIVHSIAVSGDTVFCYFSSVGISTESFMGMPANSKIIMSGVDIIRFEGDKAAEHWNFITPNEMVQMMKLQMKSDMPMMKKKK